MIRTEDDYWKFRDEVLRKATGANIHDINNNLGNILNRVAALEDPDEFWDKYREKYKADIDSYEQTIYKLLNYAKF